jgi:hypothetical protein
VLRAVEMSCVWRLRLPVLAARGQLGRHAWPTEPQTLRRHLLHATIEKSVANASVTWGTYGDFGQERARSLQLMAGQGLLIRWTK